MFPAIVLLFAFQVDPPSFVSKKVPLLPTIQPEF
jgi:hypothetical protein